MTRAVGDAQLGQPVAEPAQPVQGLGALGREAAGFTAVEVLEGGRRQDEGLQEVGQLAAVGLAKLQLPRLAGWPPTRQIFEMAEP
ncbi:hypothetical protein BRD56_12260 [Thermoplasmatales archaeon SW_10_69_26]|nr:MAG: hypothetical protein BRD56_12260 [Thermoplasmatales archaeon SW_10_69_26]